MQSLGIQAPEGSFWPDNANQLYSSTENYCEFECFDDDYIPSPYEDRCVK